MITAYVPNGPNMKAVTVSAGDLPSAAVWIDLLNPQPEEVAAVEALCAIDVPTREEMVEIEVSSRLYSEDGADFMTASVVFGLDSGRPSFAPVTFMLAKKRLVTLRYSEPKSFAIFASKLCRDHAGSAPTPPATAKADPPPDVSETTPSASDPIAEPFFSEEGTTGAGATGDITEGGAIPAGTTAKTSAAKDRSPTADLVLIGLLETVIDRVADLLEAVSADLDKTGDDIFASSTRKKPTGTDDFKSLLRRIGAAGDLTSRVRESLATIDRLLPFLQMAIDRRKPGGRDAKPRVKAMARDVQSLNDFVSFLSNKTTFLLDTTVGMISIEQNAIIKIFSVAAVAFLPPTLIASIYGMNFQNMPELGWTFGYPYALGLMVISAVLPMAFFRYKNWL